MELVNVILKTYTPSFKIQKVHLAN